MRLAVSGVNPGDTNKRQGWLGSPMTFSRVIPHSDGAGVIDAIGPDVDGSRWVPVDPARPSTRRHRHQLNGFIAAGAPAYLLLLKIFHEAATPVATRGISTNDDTKYSTSG